MRVCVCVCVFVCVCVCVCANTGAPHNITIVLISELGVRKRSVVVSPERGVSHLQRHAWQEECCSVTCERGQRRGEQEITLRGKGRRQLFSVWQLFLEQYLINANIMKGALLLHSQYPRIKSMSAASNAYLPPS
jgi:hypothetical protein